MILAFIGVGWSVDATITHFGPDLTLNEITLRHIGLLTVAATMGVWLIRLLVRNYLSHVHLAHDAAERVAMMQTYLALIEEGKLQDEGHRNLILQALFRPASSGIVKDDASPPFMAEWLKRTTGTDT